jgi:hypothetical protein
MVVRGNCYAPQSIDLETGASLILPALSQRSETGGGCKIAAIWWEAR